MKRKFLFRTFLFIFLSSLLSILLFSFLIYYQVRENNYQIAYDQAYEVQNKFRTELLNTIADYDRLAVTWAQDENIQELFIVNEDSVTNEVYNTIYSEIAEKDSKPAVTILDQENTPILSTNTETQEIYNRLPKQWGMFREIHQSKDTVIYPSQKTPALDFESSLSIGTPILKTDEIIGYIVIDFPHSIFNEIYHSMTVPYHIDLILSDHNYFSFYDSREVKQRNHFLSELFQNNFSLKSDLLKEKQTKNETIIQQKIPEYDLLIYTLFPYDLFENLASEIFLSFGLILVFLFMIAALISYFLAITLYRPIGIIMENMHKVEKKGLAVRFPVTAHDEMSSIANQFNNMMETIQTLIKVNEETQDAIHIAEMKALQSQMKPHFLYNVLNSIKFMARLNNVPEIDGMVTNLANLLRANIAIDKKSETIDESVQLVESYLKIQSFRYEDDLKYEIFLEDEVKDALLPRLIIQPLVENAIEHGVEEVNKQGKLFLSIIENNNYCILILEDNGKGIDPQIVNNFKMSSYYNEEKQSDGNGIGLRNVYQRLQYYFGNQFEMNIYNTGGTSVMISFPIRR